MLQFNLLPDVKQEYIKAKRTKRIILVVSYVLSGASISFVILLFGAVNIQQKSHISNLTDDIASATAQINETENLDTILTTQSQIALLGDIHTTKPESSRIFSLMTFVSPSDITLRNLDLSIDTSTMIISGNSSNAASVNLLVDNIKATRFVTGDLQEPRQVFSSVITSINGSSDGTTFDITMQFDPEIFSNATGLFLSIGSQEFVPIIVKEENTNE